MGDEKKFDWPDGMPFPWDAHRFSMKAEVNPSAHNIGWALLDLHDRTKALELKAEIGGYEIMELEKQVLESQRQSPDPRAQEYAVRRDLASLEARVAQFVEWVNYAYCEGCDQAGDRVDIPAVYAKLRELGLVKEGK